MTTWSRASIDQTMHLKIAYESDKLHFLSGTMLWDLFLQFGLSPTQCSGAGGVTCPWIPLHISERKALLRLQPFETKSYPQEARSYPFYFM